MPIRRERVPEVRWGREDTGSFHHQSDDGEQQALAVSESNPHKDDDSQQFKDANSIVKAVEIRAKEENSKEHRKESLVERISI